MKVLAVVFGALFTASTAWCLGTLLLRRLRLPLYRLEEGLLAFIVGSACLSEILFAVAAVHLARTWFFVALGVLALGAAFFTGAFRGSSKGKLPALPRAAWVLYAAVFLAFLYYYLGQALAPEFSPDGVTYHLGTVLKYYRAHGFVRVPTNMYANLSQGLELLFLFAFAFGKHSSAAMVHLSFLVSLPLLMICYGRRIGRPWVGVAGAIFFYAAPVAGMDGSVAYNDVAVAAILFSIFYLLQIWEETQAGSLLIPVGILAGWSYAVKYTAALAILYALGFVIWRLRLKRQPVLRPIVVITVLVILFVGPWMIKNALWMSNPISPFANRLFHNPFVHVSLEEDYRQYQRHYELTSYWQIPWELTVSGDLLTGLFGPLFLLTPLMLLAARKPEGRRLLVPAIVFALPYAANVGARFLIPSAPFISLALALSLSASPLFLAALAIAHALTCWPAVLETYCDQYAWRIRGVSWKAALRIEPEDSFLSRKLKADYGMARAINNLVPPGSAVFSFNERATAYTDRLLLGRYTSATGEVLADILWGPLFPDMQARVSQSFQFSARKARKIRVVQTAEMGHALWSVSEVRLYYAGQELPRAGNWRLTAHPNPWDVQMAFDGSPVTRWRSWQGGEPGMYIEIDLGEEQLVDSVIVLSSEDAKSARLQIEAADDGGPWTTIAKQPEDAAAPLEVNLRRLATEEVKFRGVEYLLVKDEEIGAKDYQQYAPEWGLKPIVVVGGARLYQIQ